MFAESRIASVPGRITFLIVSIHTMKGISTGGVPWGTRCANIWIVLLIHPNNMNDNHNGKARVKVKVIWLVLVKIYGNSPKKLLNRINLNKEMNISVDPLILGPIRVLNSLCNVKDTLFQIILSRDGISQYEEGIIMIPMIVLIQLIDEFQLVDGSKDENRFAIISS